MKFKSLYNLLVESRFDNPDKKSSKKMDKAIRKQAGRDYDKEKRDKESDWKRKIGATIGSKLGRAVTGNRNAKRAAAEIEIGLKNNTPMSDLPSWIWRFLIPDDLRGPKKDAAIQQQKDEYSAKVKADSKDNEEPEPEPEEKPETEPEQEPEDKESEEEKAEREKKEKEAKERAEKEQREFEKAEKEADKEEEEDSEKQDTAKEFDLTS
jgi:hypothetical protein